MIKYDQRPQRSKVEDFLNAGLELTEAVLEILATINSIRTVPAAFDYFNQGASKRRYHVSKPTIYSTFNRLQKQGLVKVQKVSNRNYYKITDSGRLRFLIKKAFRDTVKPKDGLSTVVIFDIPEEKSARRGYLRRLLLKHGFINLQRSVMIGPYELHQDFFDLLQELGIRPYVTLLKSKVVYR